GLVPMWRHSERLLEYPREMTRAETNEVRQRGQRYPLVDMFLDIGRDDPLLPGRQATPDWRLNADPAAETHELMDQQVAEGFKIEPVSRCEIVDQRLQLESSVPERCIIEKQPWTEGYIGHAKLRIDFELRRVEVEKHDPRLPARLVPFVIFV